MGGKSGGGSAPPTTVPDNSGGNEQLMQLMFAMLSQQQEAPGIEPPEPAAAPVVERIEPIDFKKRQAELAEKARADFKTEQDKKHGREDTIHTSPLLEQEDQDESLLLGGDGNPTKTP
ncbi:MAG: hypothetical protein KAG66_17615 [Methylococcales bacterium]|nr:hypothetical protein [Methylococcales bacterium]